MADGFSSKTVGLDAVLGKMRRIHGMSREYGARLSCRATSGSLSKLVPGSKKQRQTVTESRSAGQNITILRFHAKGGGTPKLDDDGAVQMTSVGKARWRKIFVGTGPNRRFVKKILIRGGRKLSKARKVVQDVPPRNIQFFSEQELAVGNDIWRSGVIDVVAGKSISPDEVLVKRVNRIGRHMVASYRGHIDRSMGATGKLAPVMPGTAKSKERQTGRSNLLPLHRTGQLRDSFVYEVKRYR